MSSDEFRLFFNLSIFFRVGLCIHFFLVFSTQQFSDKNVIFHQISDNSAAALINRNQSFSSNSSHHFLKICFSLSTNFPNTFVRNSRSLKSNKMKINDMHKHLIDCSNNTQNTREWKSHNLISIYLYLSFLLIGKFEEPFFRLLEFIYWSYRFFSMKNIRVLLYTFVYSVCSRRFKWFENKFEISFTNGSRSCLSSGRRKSRNKRITRKQKQKFYNFIVRLISYDWLSAR